MPSLPDGGSQVRAIALGIEIRGSLVIRAAGEQQLDRLGMRLLGGPHQGRGAAQLFLRVHVGLLIDEDLDGVHVAVARREHQRGFPVGAGLIYVRAGLQQLLDHGRVSVGAGQAQRRRAIAIRLLHVRAGGDQEVGDVQVIAVGRPLDGGGSIGLRQVHVRLLLDQRLHGGFVALHGRIRDGTVGGVQNREINRGNQYYGTSCHGVPDAHRVVSW